MPCCRRELRLLGVDMKATWPIHRLSSLRELRVANSSRDGSDASVFMLPASLWQLPELRSLELENINVRSLPDNIPPTAKLQSLYIDRVPLTSLPDTIDRLSDLTSLTVEDGRLSGLPASLTQLSSLRVLQLSACMEEAAHLRDGLKALEHIDAHGYPLDLGPLARFSNIQSLGIRGATPASIHFGAHSMLTSLAITACPGLVELPASMGNLSQLRELRLSELAELQRMPDEISRLTALTLLSIYDCRALDAQGITSLAGLRRLDLLYIKELPVSVGALGNLELLFVHNISDIAMPADITRLTKLSSLDVNSNGFIIGDTPELSKLPRLQHGAIRINNAESANQHSRMLTGATSIINLHVNATIGVSAFPSVITTLKTLRELSLSYDNVHVEWPVNVDNLSELTELSVTNRTLYYVQRVPNFVFSLTSLRRLGIDTNTPRLPAEISRLQQLTVLHLPGTMQLCGQVTRLRRLMRIGGGIQWAGDREHVQAVAELARRGVLLQLK
jgi:Leucine-rich repeat (LRR) protein